tara:strand:- start:563 stop:1471 length:909 start_codon:yes stop_codon:yes gene_type:complete
MNKKYCITAPAKLNLNLFVKSKNENGLHFLESDICFLELCDKLYINTSKKDAFFQNKKTKSLIINPNDNLILKAINQFRLFTKWEKKFEVFLDKEIPVGAGLGGGSADAAATLILLRKIYNQESENKYIDLSSLHKIALNLGSDVPACLKSKDIKLKGYGEKVTRSKFPENYFFLLINPNVILSTRDVFKHYENSFNNEFHKNHLYFGNIKIHNSLLLSAISLAPSISPILISLKKAQNIVTYGMSGSGSTCFGIFENLDDIVIFLKNFRQGSDQSYFTWYGQKRDYNLNRVTYSKMLEKKY